MRCIGRLEFEVVEDCIVLALSVQHLHGVGILKLAENSSTIVSSTCKKYSYREMAGNMEGL